MKAHFIGALRLFLALTLLTGVAYPLAVTVLAQAAFPRQARGSILMQGGRPVGSALLAQRFHGARYFWPRPSAGDNGTNYATVPSAASNLGPTSRELRDRVLARAAAFRTAHGLPASAPVPAEMVFASGSGLDPHISPEAARWQTARVSTARQLTEDQRRKLSALVEQSVEPPQLGFLGEPRVNVLKLNLALDALR